MRTEKNILVAFILNLSFSALELAGGLLTNSVAILSDAVHDLGDAVSIGLSYFLERKSKKDPDNAYTYGYARYSILGAFITTSILATGSILVIYASIQRLFHPAEVHYDGMILMALLGAGINMAAAYFTREGDSLNQRSVNLHMLEDVLGWAVVLVGSVLMKFTQISVIDPIMSLGIALFILFSAAKNLKSILDLFLEKTPDGISIEELKVHIGNIDGVLGVHHIHVWSIDGAHHYATMHVVAGGVGDTDLKGRIRAELAEHGIGHVTIELERPDEPCGEAVCHVQAGEASGHHGHHH